MNSGTSGEDSTLARTTIHSLFPKRVVFLSRMQHKVTNYDMSPLLNTIDTVSCTVVRVITNSMVSRDSTETTLAQNVRSKICRHDSVNGVSFPATKTTSRESESASGELQESSQRPPFFSRRLGHLGIRGCGCRHIVLCRHAARGLCVSTDPGDPSPTADVHRICQEARRRGDLAIASVRVSDV